MPLSHLLALVVQFAYSNSAYFRLLNVVSDQECSKLRTKDKTDQDLAIGHSRLQGNFSGVQKEGG